MSQKLPKSSLLRKPWQYREVYRDGIRLKTKDLSLIFLASSHETSRLGISVHGIRKATKRNRIKRIIREFFRLHRSTILPATDIVFAVRSGFMPDSPSDVKNAVQAMTRQPRSKAFSF
ncbi:MAG: ribonuclease P protein component [Proteobacteria bacterium]|nr:ribonuclease P protein component [Pseudomonadota bacterium]MBU1708599.1 ribonuclease P protein component [Pseudomonadota bacterium]